MAETLIRTFGGNIGIGTTNPGNYKLWVEGGIKADSMRVGGADNTQVPIGLIWMWYGLVADIPSGWALCNGQTVVRTDNGQNIVTPNLVDHFIRGADGDAPSPAVALTTGGIANNTITISSPQLPIHTHSVQKGAANAPHSGHPLNAQNAPHSHQSTGQGNAHNHGGSNAANIPHAHNYNYRKTQPGVGDDFVWAGDCKASQSDEGRNTSASNAPHGHNCNYTGSQHTHPLQTNNVPHNHNLSYANMPHSHTVALGNTGSGGSVNIKNPYYILAYIMKH